MARRLRLNRRAAPPALPRASQPPCHHRHIGQRGEERLARPPTRACFSPCLLSARTGSLASFRAGAGSADAQPASAVRSSGAAGRDAGSLGCSRTPLRSFPAAVALIGRDRSPSGRESVCLPPPPPCLRLHRTCPALPREGGSVCLPLPPLPPSCLGLHRTCLDLPGGVSLPSSTSSSSSLRSRSSDAPGLPSGRGGQFAFLLLLFLLPALAFIEPVWLSLGGSVCLPPPPLPPPCGPVHRTRPTCPRGGGVSLPSSSSSSSSLPGPDLCEGWAAASGLLFCGGPGARPAPLCQRSAGRRPARDGGQSGEGCPTCASPPGARRWSGWRAGRRSPPSPRPAVVSSARWTTTRWPASCAGTAASWRRPAAAGGTSTSSATGRCRAGTSGAPWPPTPCPPSTAARPAPAPLPSGRSSARGAPTAPGSGALRDSSSRRTPAPRRSPPRRGSDPPPLISLLETKEPTRQKRLFQKIPPMSAQWNKHPRNPAQGGIKRKLFVRIKNIRFLVLWKHPVHEARTMHSFKKKKRKHIIDSPWNGGIVQALKQNRSIIE